MLFSSRQMEKINKIKTVKIFKGMPDKEIHSLAEIAIEKRYQKNQIIFSQGDESDGFYTVISGKVRVFRISPEGKEQIIHLIGPGESFGEVAVFSEGNFPAYSDTIQKSEILYFPRSKFKDLIRTNPSLALNMLAELSMLLRILVTKVEELTLKDVPARLATYLILESERMDNSDIVNLDISKSQLANLLGTIPETLSRILTRMLRDDIIAFTAQRSIRILNRDRLDDLAFGERRLSK